MGATMNEYAARSMLIDIAAGQRIILVERDLHAVREAMRVIAAENERIAWGAVVRRTNGAERVAHPGGGWIIFATPLSSRMRGLSADVVFIDNDAHRVLVGELIGAAELTRIRRFNEDVALAVGSRGGKVVYS